MSFIENILKLASSNRGTSLLDSHFIMAHLTNLPVTLDSNGIQVHMYHLWVLNQM